MLYGMSEDEKDASQNSCVYSGVLMNYEHKVEKNPNQFSHSSTLWSDLAIHVFYPAVIQPSLHQVE